MRKEEAGAGASRKAPAKPESSAAQLYDTPSAESLRTSNSTVLDRGRAREMRGKCRELSAGRRSKVFTTGVTEVHGGKSDGIAPFAITGCFRERKNSGEKVESLLPQGSQRFTEESAMALRHSQSPFGDVG